MKVAFSKYSGAGNDFILIDHRQPLFELDKQTNLLCHLCDRKNGIGADGVIFLVSSLVADFGMRIFNADGSEAEMCGNGLRCLARFVEDIGCNVRTFIVETPLAPQKQHNIEIQPHSIRIQSPFSKQITRHHFPDQKLEGYFLDTGVPHLVFFVPNVDTVDLPNLGNFFRNHLVFAPRGTNVNFASIENKFIILRTYERGVEGETLACGTGAMATALAAFEAFNLPSPIAIKVRSEDFLKISFNEGCSTISMEGPARRTFQGNFHIEDFPVKR